MDPPTQKSCSVFASCVTCQRSCARIITRAEGILLCPPLPRWCLGGWRCCRGAGAVVVGLTLGSGGGAVVVLWSCWRGGGVGGVVALGRGGAGVGGVVVLVVLRWVGWWSWWRGGGSGRAVVVVVVVWWWW